MFEFLVVKLNIKKEIKLIDAFRPKSQGFSGQLSRPIFQVSPLNCTDSTYLQPSYLESHSRLVVCIDLYCSAFFFIFEQKKGKEKDTQIWRKRREKENPHSGTFSFELQNLKPLMGTGLKTPEIDEFLEVLIPSCMFPYFPCLLQFDCIVVHLATRHSTEPTFIVHSWYRTPHLVPDELW